MIDKLQVKTEVYRFLRVLATIFAIIAASKTIVWPWILQKYFSGPAIVMNSVAVEPGALGEKHTVNLELDKIRPCLPKSASLQIQDVKDYIFSVDLNWDSPLPVRTGQKVSFNWIIPENINPGKIKAANLEIWHWRCSDGADPTRSVIHFIEPFVILPSRARVPGPPAVVMHKVTLSPGYPGDFAEISLELDKVRPCRIQYAALQVTDAEGRENPIETNLTNVNLRTEAGQKPKFAWKIPELIAQGKTQGGTLDIWHHQCTDGKPDPIDPVKTPVEPTTVYKRSRR